LGVFEGTKANDILGVLPLNKENLSPYLEKSYVDATLGQTLLFAPLQDTATDHLWLIGCGPNQELSDKDFKELIQKTFITLLNTTAKEVVCCLTELPVKDRDILWKIRQIVEIAHQSAYRFESFKSKKNSKRISLKHITLMVTHKADCRKGTQTVVETEAIAEGVRLTRDLGNCPPNICTPIYLAKEAEKLASTDARISSAILDEKEIAALKMGSFLSVAKGSQNPPRLITLEYRGRKDKQKPIVLVGKGITFDTGGNSLKPAINMVGMKYDMCGAATVLGVIKAVALLELPLNIVGIIAAAENMPGQQASRPDDIITSMSGLTIEILNTDAEGRLILCDALTYCERFKPEVVIDIATLTGACMVALGPHASAVLSNHEPLAHDLLKAGFKSGDRCWQLPLWEEYQEGLNSAVADIANIGNASEAGTIIGASFLQRFVKGYYWAHLDIASVAYKGTPKDRSATGRPVALVVQYLLDRAQQN
jgi:leucyl aminopeptidase